jgi:hypothetical protein
MWGTGRNLVAPLLGYSFPSERKELISLIRLINNFNLHNLYSNPRCHVVAKAFSIFKNITAVDMILFKFKVIWFVSLIML